MKKTNVKNVILLILTAGIWGMGFVAQSEGMKYVGPYTFMVARNLLATLFLLPFIIVKRVRHPRKEEKKAKSSLVRAGVFAGIALTVAASLQQIGIMYTTVGKAGFLTALYVIFVPFISWLFLKTKIHKKIWWCVGLAVAGMALLCLKADAPIQMGDVLELLCALAFSVHILILDYFTEKVDPVELSCLQFLVCSVISAIPMIIMEKPDMGTLLNAWQPIVYAGVLSSGVGYTLQAVGQKDCDPTLASIILCMESVFSALFGWMILKQNLSVKELFGCVVMFAAIVIANLPNKKNSTN